MTGQKAFGAAILEVLEGLPDVEIAAVAAPGAGEDRLRHVAQQRGLPWVPSEEWRAEAVPERTDLIVAAHSHAFIGRKSRSRARHGAIGYHPSLLPRHRGRDAVRWTVHMGDPIAGGTVYYFTDNVDAGPIVLQDWCHVDPRWAASDLWREELFPMGVRLLRGATAVFAAFGGVEMRPQNERVATWEPSWERPPLHRPELPELNSGYGKDERLRREEGGAVQEGRRSQDFRDQEVDQRSPILRAIALSRLHETEEMEETEKTEKTEKTNGRGRLLRLPGN